MTTLELESRIQRIYYIALNGEILSTVATSSKRISKNKAIEILNERKVPYKEVIKVQYEAVKMNFDIHELLSKIKE